MNVRAATSADIPELLGLIGSYWQFEGIDGFDPARIAPVLRRLLHEPRLGRIWVAQSDSALVGYLIAVLMMRPSPPKWATGSPSISKPRSSMW